MLTHRQTNIFDAVIFTLIVTGIVMSFFISGYWHNAALSRMIVKDIHILEQAIHLFHESYNYFPGDMPDATKYWDVSKFNKHCIYWDVVSGTENQFTKGINGNGNNMMKWSNFGGSTEGMIIKSDNTDSFYEITAAPCHLKLAGVLNHTKIEPVVLNGYNIGDNHRISGIKIAKDNFLATHHNRDGQYEIILSRMHSWVSAVDNSKKYRYSLNNTSMNAKQLYMIDNKIDDGKPGTGKLQCVTKITNAKNCIINYNDSTCNGLSSCCSDYEIIDGEYHCNTDSSYMISEKSRNVGYVHYTSPLLQKPYKDPYDFLHKE
ncbi:hypothetical protein CAXC1_70046 [Candidatus Xenohaliotis californiensis]|uniref:Type II secretion system protein G n=1 Tax=Candidatus Xenohaliotis californiensis TaxID=84677 RepID=A0ABM9N9D1_9RICK|nr:hypothetical protein CAXC1_70046 [Candidatus Xenohaliotis californiensis]